MTVGVSIHAPARGATRMAGHQSHDAGSFNPRTREGCDKRPGETFSLYGRCFNPRTREGCDRETFSPLPPVWSFNPRTREGCDVRHNWFHYCQRRFQSTHPRGVRPAQTNPPVKQKASFNPRTREGCDEVVVMLYIFDSTVSIHAPARGATTPGNINDPNVTLFQSTHPRGVRRSIMSA